MSRIIFASSSRIGCLIDNEIKAVIALIKVDSKAGEVIMELNPTKSFAFFITEDLSAARVLLTEGLHRQMLNQEIPPKIPQEFLYE